MKLNKIKVKKDFMLLKTIQIKKELELYLEIHLKRTTLTLHMVLLYNHVCYY